MERRLNVGATETRIALLMNQPKAIFFDLDETLLDGSGLQTTIARTCNILAEADFGLDADRLMQANREIWPGYWQEIEEKWTLGQLDGAAVRAEAWRRTLSICGCIDESVVRSAFETHARLALLAHRLFDDVKDLLARLKSAGFRLALVTNGASDDQRSKLSALGLDQTFDAVAISAETGIAKPQVAAFVFVLEKLSLEASCAWHVGDNLTTDVASAKAAGLTAVWLNRAGRIRKEGDPVPDTEIGTLAELSARLLKRGPSLAT